MVRVRHELRDAAEELSRRDPVLARAIARHGPPRLGSGRPRQPPFVVLTRSICHQQLAGAAARTIHGRFEALFDGEPSAEAALGLSTDQLRSAGLSAAKAASIQDLALRAASGELALERAGRLDDEEIVRRLVTVRGIGRWTAEMFLMSSLGRLDVWPVDDFGVRKGYARLYGLDPMPSPKVLATLGEPHRPFRSVVAWVLLAGGRRSRDVKECGRAGASGAASAPRSRPLPLGQSPGHVVLVVLRCRVGRHADQLRASRVVRGGVPRRLEELVRPEVRTGWVVRGVVSAALDPSGACQEGIPMVWMDAGGGLIVSGRRRRRAGGAGSGAGSPGYDRPAHHGSSGGGSLQGAETIDRGLELGIDLGALGLELEHGCLLGGLRLSELGPLILELGFDLVRSRRDASSRAFRVSSHLACRATSSTLLVENTELY